MIQVQVDDDAVPDNLLDRVQRLMAGLGFRYGWKSQKSKDWPGHWNAQILRAGFDNTEDVSAALRQLPEPFGVTHDFWEWLRDAKYGGRADLLRCYANQMTFGTEGYPHTDADRPGEFTTLLYVNQEWKREWAGTTEVWDEAGEEIERSVMPKPGRLLTFPGTRLHRAASVSRICPVARTTLIYKVRP